MKLKRPPQARKPSILKMRWIGLLLAVVGFAKVLDALFLTPESDVLRQPTLIASAAVGAVGLFLFFVDGLLAGSRPTLEPEADLQEGCYGDEHAANSRKN